VLSLTAIWATRLTWHWARGWDGLQDEDWRYTMYREDKEGKFWIINLFGLQLMPTIAVYLACLSLYPALFVKGTTFNLLDLVGVIITSGAILIEAVADKQLRDFIQEREDSEKIMDEGLWNYSRHPNYFGEISFWFGLYFFALATDIHFWWTIIGPILILLLFYFISIPLMDQRNLSRRPNYEKHMKKVSKLLLLPPKKED
jgi:steroid 5-alpha reductase family enzyme